MTTITIDRAVVEQALEALESVYGDSCDALHALRAALAQQAEPVEPVAWIQPDHLQKARVAPFLCRVEPTKRCADFVPFWTAPPQRKPLSEDEIEAAAKSVPAAVYELMHGHEITVGRFRAALAEVARAVERAHEIGEGA